MIEIRLPHAACYNTTSEEALVTEALVARFMDRPKYRFIDLTVDEKFNNAHKYHAPTNAVSGLMEIVKHLYTNKVS